jgi:hypothetical protein
MTDELERTWKEARVQNDVLSGVFLEELRKTTKTSE